MEQKLTRAALTAALLAQGIELVSYEKYHDGSFKESLPESSHTHVEFVLVEPITNPITIITSGSAIPPELQDAFELKFYGGSTSEGFAYVHQSGDEK